jgi:hypothetical protein
MLDATGKKLLILLQPGQAAPLRAAAALVVGEIGLREKETAQQLLALVSEPGDAPRQEAMTALGKLRVEAALPRLLDRVRLGGPEADTAAHAAAQLGAKGAKALRDLMGAVAPGLRRRIAAALAASGTMTDSPSAVVSLLDSDPGVVDAAARTLSTEIPTLSEKHRKALADHLFDLLRSSKKSGLPSVSETAIIRLLGALQDGRAESILWERTQPAHAPDLRAAALSALGARSGAPTKEQFKRLLICAGDTDFRIAAPALLMLKEAPGTKALLPAWLTLFDAPDPAVRRLGIDKAGTHDNPQVASALLGQLNHPDRSLRENAIARLGRLDSGRKAMAQALLDAETPDHAWILARAQEPFAATFETALRKRLLDRACNYLERNDRRADALLAVLRAANFATLRDALGERALALRKKKKYEAAMHFLRLLARDPACGTPTRMELAACGLKLSTHDLSTEARAANPCLNQFAAMVHSGQTDQVTAFLRKAKWLDPAELFYLGFHFAEKEREEKEFGGQVLRLVMERAKKSKIGKDARSKLRNEGLD